MEKIVIEVGGESFDAELDEERAPGTVRAILEALPIEGRANTWGEEIYFRIPVDIGPENGVERVQVGDLGYWPDGSAFCLFFGRTPVSPSADDIRPASAVNPIGRVHNPEGLKRHRDGEPVRISAAG